MDDAQPSLRSNRSAGRKQQADREQDERQQDAAPAEPPVWEVASPKPDPTPDSDLCRRRAEGVRALAAKAQDATTRSALEVVAANWESLARHLNRRAERRRPPPSSRKLQARRAALGVED